MPNTLEEAAAYAKSKVMRELQENGQIGGIKQEKIYLFPEQKNVLEDIGDGTGAGVLVGEFANVGETPPPKIHIVIDGVIYERENIPDESRPTTTGVYGNGSYFGGVGANNDNFAVMLNTEANSLFAMFIDPETQMPLLAGATVTFGIYTQTETIHPIDPKYLPASSGGGLPVVEMSFDGDSFNSKPVSLHTTTQGISDALDAVLSKEPPVFVAVFPNVQFSNGPFVMLFTRYGDFMSEHDLKMYPRYIGQYMMEEGHHWHFELYKGEFEWGEHNKWMMQVRTLIYSGT